MLWKNEISWDLSLRWISARWRHQMKIFSALLAFCAGNSPVTGEFPHKSQWHGALMFSLIGAWMDDWVNNYEAGDLRRHRTHYDVTVMERNPKLQEPQGPISTIGSFLICVVMKDTTLYLTHPPLEKMTHFADYFYKWLLFRNEKLCILIQISLKFVPNGPNDNHWFR